MAGHLGRRTLLAAAGTLALRLPMVAAVGIAAVETALVRVA